LDRLLEYLHKCKILRQIQSNKARKYRSINNIQNLLTVIISAFITFIGFSGITKISEYVNWIVTSDVEKVQFAFNLLVFFLFVLVILHLVFQFGRKQSESERAIVTLTTLINEIDDILDTFMLVDSNSMIFKTDLVRQKYETISQVIPPNSDKEFLKAKKDFELKEIQKSKYGNIWKEIFEIDKQQNIIVGIIKSSDIVMKILYELREINEELYLGGGIIRNLVWDYLHQYKNVTPIEDIDIIHFDKINSAKASDEKIEERLIKQLPNFKLSVKNQARMHISNIEAEYSDLQDAISKWPETCTAFILRINKEDKIEFIAPFGFNDLFRLIVYPTPHFFNKIDKYMERINRKNWGTIWSKLRIFKYELDNGKLKATT